MMWVSAMKGGNLVKGGPDPRKQDGPDDGSELCEWLSHEYFHVHVYKQ